MKILRYLLLLLGTTLLALIILGQTKIGNLSSSVTTKDETQFIEIDNNKIRYSQIGEGKDILFIHGTPGSIED